MACHELSIEERVTIQVGLLHGFGVPVLGRVLNRRPSTVRFYEHPPTQTLQLEVLE